MSRSNEHVHGSRRLHRALGLSLSGAALVGLFYFEGLSARAEVGAEVSEAEVEEVDEADEVELEADAAEDDYQRSGRVLAAAHAEAKVEPMILPPSGAAMPTVAAAPVDGQLAMATIADAEAATAKPVDPPAPALVVVPDIEGMSLRKAKKALKAVGLKMSVRDEYDWPLPREAWGEYKVRKQKLEAGTEVAPGSTVKVKARMLARYAMGY